MKNIRIDTYDCIILVDINRDPHKTIRELAERLPLEKTQVAARIQDLVELGLLITKGKTKGAKRSLTDKGVKWLLENGYTRT